MGVAGFFTYQALAGSLVYFILPSEYAAEPDKYDGRVRLGGIVEAGSVNFDDESLELAFRVTDYAQTYPVRYIFFNDYVFKEIYWVVVVGNFEDNTFVSNEVLIKHSEEYRPAAGKPVDLEDLKNALE